MTLYLEVISRFQDAVDADRLLYTPIHANLTSRHSRVYAVEVSGQIDAAREYLLSVLVDQIAQEVREQQEPLLKGALFILDYGMKPGALDLEKQAILQNYSGREGLPFTIDSLKITQRVYVFGEGNKEALAA
ncbi:MAG: hypothetical protein RSB48_07435, partial [Akkermansia sp.]